MAANLHVNYWPGTRPRGLGGEATVSHGDGAPHDQKEQAHAFEDF